jgi:hypothetical protein
LIIIYEDLLYFNVLLISLPTSYRQRPLSGFWVHHLENAEKLHFVPGLSAHRRQFMVLTGCLKFCHSEEANHGYSRTMMPVL